MTLPRGIGESIDGAVRAASAIDAVLEKIRQDLVLSLLPQRNDLLNALSFEESMSERVANYAQRLVRLKQWDQLPKLLGAVGLELGQLEDSIVDLRRAVSWSSRFSAFNWWLRNRQRELKVFDYLVIAGPGSCREFHIERTPSVADHFEKANLSLRIPEGSLSQIRRIRILTVPQNDGASAKWHPISLGHELAHLKFNDDWVLQWLAGQRNIRGTAARAVARAREQLESGGLILQESWFSELISWLVECACDATLHYFYGDKSKQCMSTFLSIHSDLADSKEHPSPKLRLAVLDATASAELRRFRAPQHESSSSYNRKNSFCQLAILCRDEVGRQLSDIGIDKTLREDIRKGALDDEERNCPPHSASWSWESICNGLSAIEAGLVESLWSEYGTEASEYGERKKTIERRERRVEQAVDFLQFAHRFEKGRLHRVTRLALGEPESRSAEETPTNVLYVTRNGVSAAEEAGGSATHDVRLGRHFIVFKRNQISVLNALDKDAQSRQIQEQVEVGWGEKFILHPHEMVLAVTLESLIIGDECTAQVLSRSSLGRMGLLSATAVQVQPGFRGCLTLELVNLASVPLGLSPGQRIAQIVPILKCGVGGYDGKYQDQDWKPRFSEVLNDKELPILIGLSDLMEESYV
jgi:deoxycytidine triphosphate deaminase